MIILRQFEFSDKKDKDKKNKKKLSDKDAQKDSDKILAAGGIAAGAGLIGNTASVIKMHKNLLTENKALEQENEKLYKKLLRKAKETGTSVSEVDSALKSHYNPKTDTINSTRAADIFSHEIGHRDHIKGRAGIVGKFVHKKAVHVPGRYISKAPIAISGGYGLAHGMAAGAREAKTGKKESVASRITGYLPTIASLGMVASEAAASKRGIKLLKEAGASKEYLKKARKNLRTAGGSYRSAVVFGGGVNALGRGIGKKIGRDLVDDDNE